MLVTLIAFAALIIYLYSPLRQNVEQQDQRREQEDFSDSIMQEH